MLYNIGEFVKMKVPINGHLTNKFEHINVDGGTIMLKQYDSPDNPAGKVAVEVQAWRPLLQLIYFCWHRAVTLAADRSGRQC